MVNKTPTGGENIDIVHRVSKISGDSQVIVVYVLNGLDLSHNWKHYIKAGPVVRVHYSHRILKNKIRLIADVAA